MKPYLLLCICTAFNSALFSQSSADAAVQLRAVAQNSPAQITLSWTGNTSSTQYLVYRKLKTDNQWGPLLANLSGTTNQYLDMTPAPGVSYEYRVVRSGSNYTGYGYINAGIEVPEIEFRGKLILMVDSNFISTLAPEIERLIKDIEGDGWEVIRHDVLRTGSVYHIKDLILADYLIDTTQIRAVFLLGHVPVPYSGNINPDGHPDHLGAWPADCYYGDIDGIWTDLSITSTMASPARTQNVPGDGKFDQSITPTPLELQVGRVDFNGMPTFTLTEQQLLKNYLDKDHEYRKKIFSPQKRAVVDDNFGYFGSEAFAASGYKNFGPLVDPTNVTVADYFTTMNGNSYSWSYGCGGGTYISASGIGNTGNFAAANLQGVFTMLFGSYFGDWDAQNNFLRAALAQGRVLTNVWSGRPHYQFHHMGLGENIGYGLLITQNNPGGLYYASPTGINGRWVHNALMGDPTLRNDIVAPAANIVATKVGLDCHISWSASTETNSIGYNLYMKNDSSRSYVKLNALPITGNTYTHTCLLYKGVYTYMVRTLKLETTASGSYYNMSEGISDTAYNSVDMRSVAAFSYGQSGANANLVNTSINATSYYWEFGDGSTSAAANPIATYSANGTYTIMLVASNSCYSDTSYQIITILEVGMADLRKEPGLDFYPNPSKGIIKLDAANSNELELSIFSIEGKLVYFEQGLKSQSEIDLKQLKKGIYLVRIASPEKAITKKLVLD